MILSNFSNCALSTHVNLSKQDEELTLEVCDHIILIDEDRIVADGNPREIMGDEQLMEAHGQEKPE